MYFRKRFTDSSTSTRHPRQRKKINISNQQSFCKKSPPEAHRHSLQARSCREMAISTKATAPGPSCQVRVTFGTPCLSCVTAVPRPCSRPTAASATQPPARSRCPALPSSSCAMPAGRADGSATLPAASPSAVGECRQLCDQRGLCPSQLPARAPVSLASTLTSDRWSSCCLAAIKFQLVTTNDALQ